MNIKPFLALKNMLAAQVASTMNDAKFNVSFVVDDMVHKRPIGIIHIHDIIRAGVL